MSRPTLARLAQHIHPNSNAQLSSRLAATVHMPQPTIFPTPEAGLSLGHRRKRHALPASLMRSGTSKGLFIHRKHLPASQDAWKPWILAAMGSKKNDPRQIDGVGGATSTTSKVAVIAPSSRPGVDVEYTFAQVAVGKETVDFSGNCGNIASGVGPFALEEGLIRAIPGQRQVDVRIFNTNTSRILVETVSVDENGFYEEEGDYQIAGVRGSGSEVKVAFVEPAGSMTGKLFPTSNREDTIVVEAPRNGVMPFAVQASLVDAANPFIIVDASTMPLSCLALGPKSQQYLDTIEDIRRTGAVMMGLAGSIETAALVRGTPKIALVSRPKVSNPGDETAFPNFFVESMSMGQAHPSLQLTGAVCLGAAACVEGTVVHRIAASKSLFEGMLTPERTPSASSSSSVSISDKSFGSDGETSEAGQDILTESIKRQICIAHGSGKIKVDVAGRVSFEDTFIESCSVSRTARKLFEGKVLFYL